jgi:hypothetical protein
MFVFEPFSPGIRGVRLLAAFRDQRSALSFQRSAFSDQLSAISEWAAALVDLVAERFR